MTLSQLRGPGQAPGAQPSWLSMDAWQLQPWLILSPGTHSFILLGRAKAFLLNSRHVEHVSVGQRFLDALEFLLEGEAEAG